jgi:hypothetical protein
MTRKMLMRAIVAAMIVALLGGGYVIAAKRNAALGPEREIPSAFLH